MVEVGDSYLPGLFTISPQTHAHGYNPSLQGGGGFHGVFGGGGGGGSWPHVPPERQPGSWSGGGGGGICVVIGQIVSQLVTERVVYGQSVTAGPHFEIVMTFVSYTMLLWYPSGMAISARAATTSKVRATVLFMLELEIRKRASGS